MCTALLHPTQPLTATRHAGLSAQVFFALVRDDLPVEALVALVQEQGQAPPPLPKAPSVAEAATAGAVVCAS